MVVVVVWWCEVTFLFGKYFACPSVWDLEFEQNCFKQQENKLN